MTGALIRRGGTYDFVRDGAFDFSSRLAEGGRRMELSEVVEFRDTLYAFDDRMGVGTRSTSLRGRRSCRSS